ncbi:hypothetical protein ACFQ14_07090 [Pseudahrensia aquimaris]|uniref:Uncharacterized protein n=1 Tax=Pseudahrensia aquimaris TaxID=744461 RepID=A0ABW3FIH4_9HYPH
MNIIDRMNKIFDNNLSASADLLNNYINATFQLLAARMEGDRDAVREIREARKEIREEIRAEREEYIKEFRDARDEAREKVQEAREEVFAIREVLQQARADGDREAVREAREAIQEAREAVREARAELREAREELQQARIDWKEGTAGSGELSDDDLFNENGDVIVFVGSNNDDGGPQDVQPGDFLPQPTQGDEGVLIDMEPPRDQITDMPEPEFDAVFS